MHYAFMDRIKQCYADEIEIYHTTTMIIEYDRSCAILALLAWARPSMFYILLVYALIAFYAAASLADTVEE